MKNKNFRITFLFITLFGLATATFLTGCNSTTKSEGKQATTLSTTAKSAQDLSTTAASFGKLKNGTAVNLYTLTNSKGAKASFTNYGGRLVSLLVPDKTGKLTDVVVDF